MVTVLHRSVASEYTGDRGHPGNDIEVLRNFELYDTVQYMTM